MSFGSCLANITFHDDVKTGFVVASDHLHAVQIHLHSVYLFLTIAASQQLLCGGLRSTRQHAGGLCATSQHVGANYIVKHSTRGQKPAGPPQRASWHTFRPPAWRRCNTAQTRLLAERHCRSRHKQAVSRLLPGAHAGAPSKEALRHNIAVTASMPIWQKVNAAHSAMQRRF